MADLTLSRRTRGTLCILLAALCFSAMSACVRLAGDDLPTGTSWPCWLCWH